MGHTLFLDEVAEIPTSCRPSSSASWRRGVAPVGGRSELEVDVRVLSATNRDLKERSARAVSGRTSSSASRLRDSPARPARTARDIPLLVQHFLDKFSRSRPSGSAGAAPGHGRAAGHDWPGNIRELKNAVERAVITSARASCSPVSTFPRQAGRARTGTSSASPTASPSTPWRGLHPGQPAAERNNKARTAEILGVSEKTLYNKLNRYGREAKAAAAAPGGSEPTAPPLVVPANAENS
jgi:DNA-binding NtrC family response regulator